MFKNLRNFCNFSKQNHFFILEGCNKYWTCSKGSGRAGQLWGRAGVTAEETAGFAAANHYINSIASGTTFALKF